MEIATAAALCDNHKWFILHILYRGAMHEAHDCGPDPCATVRREHPSCIFPINHLGAVGRRTLFLGHLTPSVRSHRQERLDGFPFFRRACAPRPANRSRAKAPGKILEDTGISPVCHPLARAQMAVATLLRHRERRSRSAAMGERSTPIAPRFSPPSPPPVMAFCFLNVFNDKSGDDPNSGSPPR